MRKHICVHTHVYVYSVCIHHKNNIIYWPLELPHPTKSVHKRPTELIFGQDAQFVALTPKFGTFEAGRGLRGLDVFMAHAFGKTRSGEAKP